MTREELKEHCKRQVQQFERVEKIMPVTPNDWKRYEEHKLILELLEQEPKTGHCRDCKYFEYDSVAKVDGAPLIVAHEICSKWGNGCKTKEDGYCFLFEPQKSEGQTREEDGNKEKV